MWRCDAIAKEVFSPTEGNLVGEFSSLRKEFEMEFDIQVEKFSSSHASILYIEADVKCCDYEGMILAFRGFGVNRFGVNRPALEFSSYVSGENVTLLSIEPHKWIKIKYSQYETSEGAYLLQISLDGFVVWGKNDKQSADFENVKLFASGPFSLPASNVKLRNILLCSKGK